MAGSCGNPRCGLGNGHVGSCEAPMVRPHVLELRRRLLKEARGA